METFFNWLNKDPETKKEGFAQAAVGLGLFVTLFALMGFAGTWIGA